MSKEIMQAMGSAIGDTIPKGFGYALIIFPFGGSCISNYISNADRSDMIKALRETADALEGKKVFQTPSENSN